MRLTNGNYSNYLLICLVSLTEDKFASSHTINSHSNIFCQRPAHSSLSGNVPTASKNENPFIGSTHSLFGSSNYNPNNNVGPLFLRSSNYNPYNNVGLFGRPSNEYLNHNDSLFAPRTENPNNNSSLFLPRTENPNNIINIWYLNKSSNTAMPYGMEIKVFNV